MDRNTRKTRRRMLGMAGATVSTMLVAGCGGPGEDDNGADPEEDPVEEPDDPEDDPDAEEGTGNGQEMNDEEEP
ncbi:hypothetical protein [Natrarchaeobius oligotrophus]|uniref:Uncharacterized protein n=1 Tax=Natrarchaeobius chitinivorans TaxID=1679083 RepID=A0A3N6MQP4_NATCH|nr:hypothetical protein [Natrarchaeobius chitinivorans]RQG98571.1 hypothetical protein EA472_17360 [Natrarchaeobius chitinivorans]